MRMMIRESKFWTMEAAVGLMVEEHLILVEGILVVVEILVVAVTGE
jgi:hypothetical protein